MVPTHTSIKHARRHGHRHEHGHAHSQTPAYMHNMQMLVHTHRHRHVYKHTHAHMHTPTLSILAPASVAPASAGAPELSSAPTDVGATSPIGRTLRSPSASTHVDSAAQSPSNTFHNPEHGQLDGQPGAPLLAPLPETTSDMEEANISRILCIRSAYPRPTCIHYA